MQLEESKKEEEKRREDKQRRRWDVPFSLFKRELYSSLQKMSFSVRTNNDQWVYSQLLTAVENRRSFALIIATSNISVGNISSLKGRHG